MTGDPVVDSRPATCWLDAFPWIEAATGGTDSDDVSEQRWWLEPIDASGSPSREERLARLSDLALERLTRWAISQIFPGLAADTSLSHLSLNNRARTTLAQLGYRAAGDLLGLELGDLLDMPQVGVGAVDSILQALADVSTSAASPVLFPVINEERGLAQKDDQLVSWGESAIEDLRLIAAWYAALGMPTQPLLGNRLAPGTPATVVRARRRLEAISAADVLERAQSGLDAADLLEACIGGLDRRAQNILARRFFADRPETLDELGRSLGVTRERVRQIEAKARANMVGFLEPGGTLELSSSAVPDISAAVRDIVDMVLPLDELLASIPALARTVEAVNQPAWRVLDRLDDAYEIADGWCASPSVRGAQSATLTQLQELADHHGVVGIKEIGSLNPNQTEDAGRRSLREWLLYCGFVIDGDFVFTRNQSVGDRAASILSIAGSPLSAQEILDRFGVERSLGSLKNAMGTDDRFERVDRDQWALAEWGLESYGGVRALVREEVARSGGQVAMDALIEHITGKYSVTASSVATYASSLPFETKSGIVRFASTDRNVRRNPDRTRRLYRHDAAWAYRIRVSKDHLRGSGSVAPVAIASILGLQYGDTRQLESDLGPQGVSWVGAQPTFGTIRRFLVAQDVEIGSEIFLVIGDDGSFHVETVDAGEGDPLDRALSLIGADYAASHQPPRIVLARAIGLPEGSPVASVIGGYRERGDGDIAELLTSAKDQLVDGATRRPVSDADINEILDLL